MPKIIEQNPKVLGGEPVIKGTRIPVARVVALVVKGYKIKDFKSDYPYLKITKKDIHDILNFYSQQFAK